MTARLIDRPLGEGWNTLTKLVMDARFTGSLADEIRKPGGVDRAFKALTLEFFPAPAATVVSAPEVQDLYVLPLLDADVPEAHKATAAKYRALAREWGVPDTHAVCYLVREGFTLKGHAAKAGPCYKDFVGLQGWNFQDDPTAGCLMFWIPRVVPGSLSEDLANQRKLLAKIAKKAKLPEGHFTSLGSVALNAALILAHYQATGERIPEKKLWIRTETYSAVSGRLLLGGFVDEGLDCGSWDWVGGGLDDVGVFALGMVLES